MLFVSLVGALGRPGSSLFPESNFKFSSVRYFVRRIQRVSSTVALSQFVDEDLFKLVSVPLWVPFY